MNMCKHVRGHYSITGRTSEYFADLKRISDTYNTLYYKLALDTLDLPAEVLTDVRLLTNLYPLIRGATPPLVEAAGKAIRAGIPFHIVQNIVGDVVDIEDQEYKFVSYIAAITEECSTCYETFSQQDYLDKRILRVSCCLKYLHAPCASEWLKPRRTCPLCRAELEVDKHEKHWNAFLETIHKKMLTGFGLLDAELASDIAKIEQEEQSRRKKQIEDDAKLAILLSRQTHAH